MLFDRLLYLLSDECFVIKIWNRRVFVLLLVQIHVYVREIDVIVDFYDFCLNYRQDMFQIEFDYREAIRLHHNVRVWSYQLSGPVHEELRFGF